MELRVPGSSLVKINPTPKLRFERLNARSASTQSALSMCSVLLLTDGSFSGSSFCILRSSDKPYCIPAVHLGSVQVLDLADAASDIIKLSPSSSQDITS